MFSYIVGERNIIRQEIQQNFNDLTLSLINTHSGLYYYYY